MLLRKCLQNFTLTDGCGKQYRCGSALYLLSLLASQKHVVVDRAIGASGHGKDIVDGLNATDKRFLKGKMCPIGSPEANDSAHRMVAHSMVEGASKSLAEEGSHLCSDEARTSGVKGSVKSEKRETNSKLKLRKYHVQQAETVKFRDLKMEVTGLPKKTKQSHNGLLAHYNIRVERDLGIDMAALWRIPCACDGCINQLDLKNVRARYASSITSKYWCIFEGLNDWKITKLVPASDDYEDDLDEAKQMVLQGMATEAAEQINIGQIGSFLTNDADSDGYYVVEWTSEPYTLQEAGTLVEYDPLLHLEKGELVSDGQYLNKVPGAKQWYTPPSKPLPTTVRLQQVLNPVLHMVGISQQNKLS
jgi:hypothetical protein